MSESDYLKSKQQSHEDSLDVIILLIKAAAAGACLAITLALIYYALESSHDTTQHNLTNTGRVLIGAAYAHKDFLTPNEREI